MGITEEAPLATLPIIENKPTFFPKMNSDNNSRMLNLEVGFFSRLALLQIYSLDHQHSNNLGGLTKPLGVGPGYLYF